MNIILGASGQVGSAIVNFLLEQKVPVRAVIRNPQKTEPLINIGAEISIADYYNLKALKESFAYGDTVFILTPETGYAENIIDATKTLLQNYRIAIETSGIRKIVGLSSIGAQHPAGTGNLQMSYLLEKAFTGLPVQQVFIRPAYYYSNWLNSLPTVIEQRILTTFFPAELKFPMVSPQDTAKFIAEIIINDNEESGIYELEGPESYSSLDAAIILGKLLNQKVEVQEITRNIWEKTLHEFGFSDNAVKNFTEMMDAVVDGRARPEGKGVKSIRLTTSLEEYFKNKL